MSIIAKPCIICGTLTPGATRCKRHQVEQSRQRETRRTHYRGSYRKRSAKIRNDAELCWICGQGPIDGDPWTADHLIPGDPDSPLAAAHRSCNSRRGNGAQDTTGPKRLF